MSDTVRILSEDLISRNNIQGRVNWISTGSSPVYSGLAGSRIRLGMRRVSKPCMKSHLREITGDFEAVVSDFPRKPDGKTKSLNSVKAKASQLAVKLIDTFERKLAKAAELASKKSRSQSESAV